uniref:Zinc finger protein 239-like n=1 Tax=Acanthochromis polyacanthus TaxID=80966 RepID=A0A3Q1EDS9_9TELE
MNKLPVPPLLTAAYTAETSEQQETVSENRAKTKEPDGTRTRINIGGAFRRWRKLRDLKGFKTDAEIATFLLDRYQASSLAAALTPDKPKRDDERTGLSEMHGIAVEVLDRSPSLLDVHDDTGKDDVNHIQHPEIEWAEDETWAPVEELEDISTSEEEETTEEDGYNDDSDDEDYIPPSCVRAGGAVKTKTDVIQSIGKNETVCDAVDAELKEQIPETRNTPEVQKSMPHNQLGNQEDNPSENHHQRLNRRHHEEHSPETQHNTLLSEEPKHSQGFHRPHKTYKCPTCGKVFPRNQALKRHLVIHSGKRPFKCFICGRGFTQSGNLKTHMKVHRGELTNWTLVKEKSPAKESPVTVHLCGECGMDFPEKHLLEEHRGSHKKPYACPDCDKSFKNESYFKIHQRVHSGETPYICSECGKSCVTAVLLKKHELTHTGEKNFHCGRCWRAFSQSSHLKMHLKTHTGERPHLCSVCGKSYSRAHTLKVHLRVHTGEKPYSCEKCGKCFFYSQNYHVHLKTHDKKLKPPLKSTGRPKQQQIVVNYQ